MATYVWLRLQLSLPLGNDSFSVLFLWPCQIIQRQLEQVEEKQRQLEERGVAVEKALRGEAGNGPVTQTSRQSHRVLYLYPSGRLPLRL